MSRGGLASTGAEFYVAEVMATFVRYFVAFLFLEGLYLRPDSGATNMQRDRATRFVRAVCVYVCTYPNAAVHSFVRSFVRQCYFAALLYPQ